MKPIFYLSLLLFICACSENETDQEDDLPKEEIPPFDYSNSTAYEFEPVDLSFDFYTDTIHLYDSAKHVSCTAVQVKSDRMRFKHFNQCLHQLIIEDMQYEIAAVEFVDTLYDPYHTYYRAPISFYKDSAVISVTYVIDTYTQTGNHHNYVYRTFNYDWQNLQPIWYGDYFNLKTRSDSFRLQDIAYNCRQKERCFHWESISDTVDFAFSAKGITFRPSMAWSCNEGVSIVPYDSLKSLTH